jgi:hypothetical protein
MVKDLINFCYAFLASAREYKPRDDQWKALFKRASALRISSTDME